jgi:mRNA interferase MazF
MGDPDFADSGLKAASLIRLGFLVTLPISHFIGSIGSISYERHRRLVTLLSEYLVGGRDTD